MQQQTALMSTDNAKKYGKNVTNGQTDGQAVAMHTCYDAGETATELLDQPERRVLTHGPGTEVLELWWTEGRTSKRVAMRNRSSMKAELLFFHRRID